jgi:hypothetical protein
MHIHIDKLEIDLKAVVDNYVEELVRVVTALKDFAYKKRPSRKD